MATQRPEIKRVRNNVITVDLPYVEGTETTNLSASVAAAGTALTVLDNQGLADNDYIILGVPGQERTEIKQVDGAVTLGTTITSTAVTFPHPINTPVTLIRYNQIALYGSNDPSSLAPTAIGSAVALDVESGRQEMVATTTYKYYFVRYYNSETTTYSRYSIGVSEDGLPLNSKRRIKDAALGITHEEFSGEIDEFLDEQFEFCKEEIMLSRRRWSFLRSTNQFRFKVLHNCNSITANGTWALDPDTTNDAVSVATDTTGYKEGAGAVSFSITVATSANNFATVVNSTMASVDLTEFANDGYFRFWVYIPSITNFTSISIRWGSSSSAYWAITGLDRDVYGQPLHTGWNYLEAKWEDASVTSTPDAAGIDYLYISFVYTASYTNQTSARIDHITVWDKPFSETGFAPIVTLAGVQEYDLPKNIQDGNSNDSISNIHIRNYPILEWADDEKWEELSGTLIKTELSADVVTTDTTINLVDGADFASSGSVYIGGDSISYTGRSTNQLTGVTDISTAHFTADPVYQQPNTGNPTHYTIRNGKLLLYPVIDTTYDDFNIYVTFFKNIDPTPYDSSVTDVPFYIAMVNYLAYKIFERKGKYDDADRFRGLYKEEIATAIRKESGGRRTTLRPRVPVVVERDFDTSDHILYLTR